eukprot:jgi/Tetstr1/443286/TSEL_031320.t1
MQDLSKDGRMAEKEERPLLPRSAAVEGALSRLPGVTRASVALTLGEAQVEHDASRAPQATLLEGFLACKAASLRNGDKPRLHRGGGDGETSRDNSFFVYKMLKQTARALLGSLTHGGASRVVERVPGMAELPPSTAAVVGQGTAR